MQATRIGSLALVLLSMMLSLPEAARARTWQVERDGSGDFTVIQDAIEAAFPGDVILIGPGRYTETTPVQTGGGLIDTIASVTVENLTLRGTDREAVILGPDGPEQVYALGVRASFLQKATIENLTIENQIHGITVLLEDLVVRNCVLRGCENGFNSSATGNVTIEGCLFEQNTSRGVLQFDVPGEPNLVIQDCEFRANQLGVSIQTEGAILRRCFFHDNVSAGMQLSAIASASIEQCRFENNDIGLYAMGRCVATLVENEFSEGRASIQLVNESHIVGVANQLNGGSVVTLVLDSQSTASMSQNHILREPGSDFVWARSSGDPLQIDLRDNYWGTMDAQEIADGILDATDGEGRTSTVLFEPFVGQPIATEQESFGSLKARFGPHEE